LTKCDLISPNSHGPVDTHHDIPHDSRSPDRDLKLGPSGCGAVLTRVPLYSVSLIGLFRRPTSRAPGDIPSIYLLDAESTQGHSAAGRITSMKNPYDTVGNGTYCSTILQQAALHDVKYWCVPKGLLYCLVFVPF